jgi:Flp pilus assembly protein TadB
VAKSKRKRKRKHRGTQAGSIDRRTSGRPRSRAEARARAKAGAKSRAPAGPKPPTWKGAIFKGLAAAGIFFVLVVVIFSRPVGASVLLAVFMLAFYIPLSYYTDSFFYRRRSRQIEQQRIAASRKAKGANSSDKSEKKSD